MEPIAVCPTLSTSFGLSRVIVFVPPVTWFYRQVQMSLAYYFSLNRVGSQFHSCETHAVTSSPFRSQPCQPQAQRSDPAPAPQVGPPALSAVIFGGSPCRRQQRCSRSAGRVQLLARVSGKSCPHGGITTRQPVQLSHFGHPATGCPGSV